MGILIHAYAIDLPRFDAFLDSTLAELLSRYRRDGIGDDSLEFGTDWHKGHSFIAMPRRPIFSLRAVGFGREASEFTDEELHEFPELSRSAREHFSGGSTYELKWLFQSFSNCHGIDFVERLLDGPRRWWIGSILQFAHTCLAASDYDELSLLFRKLLRGWDCGYPIPSGDVGVVTDGFPISLEANPDFRFGRWTEKDVSKATSLLSEIMSSSPTFSCPPELRPDEDNWHPHVQNMLNSLLRIRHLPYERCNVLSFIG